MKTILVIIIILSCSIFSFISSAVTRVTVEGVIVAYDKKTVTLSQNGKRIKVPKNSIPHYFKIRSGNKVYAELDSKKLVKKIQEVIQQKKMKNKKKQDKQRQQLL